VQAQQATASYYILGYYTTNANPDGKFRRIKITLSDGREATLDYRQGYYAQKVFSKFSQADKERQLEDALMLGDPVTELTIALEVGYFQLNRAEYFVPLAVKIPGSELVLAKRRGAERTLIDFLGEVKDEFGTTVANVRDKVDIKLSEATAAELSRRPIQYDTSFTLLPGKYRIKFLARDAVTGRMGTFEMRFVVPNLNKVTARIPISSVILSSQKVEIDEALFTAGKDKGIKAHSTSRLVEGRTKTIPSVTRVFSKSKELYAVLEAYQPGEAPPHTLVAYLTLYRDGQVSYQSAPVEIAEAEPNRLRTMRIGFEVNLEKVREGEQECQITVLDPESRRAAFWRAPILVLR
jgi:hypothetical protein